MLCTFCGTENRAENKFCGMCGVRLERRKTERRVSGAGSSLKCPSCGNINELGYKFCGMCGSRIERRVADRRGSGAEPRANAAVPSTPETSTGRQEEIHARRTVATAEALPHPERPASVFKSDSGPAHSGIQGPSFLGLSDEPDGEGDYLLEEERSGGGLRKLVLLAILAAILGLIFIQWRSSFQANPKPADNPATEPTPTPVGPQGAAQPSASPGVEQGSAQPSPLPSASPPASSPQPQASPKPQSGSQDPFADNGKAALVAAFGSRANIPAPPDRSENSDGDVPAAKTAPSSPADMPARPSPLLMKAQQYLQGAPGVTQNCDQGLVYLRAAAQKNEPAAAVQMGALYASGHCVKQDRVMAYRWFNSAHELQPSNTWIQRNLDQLWGQMTAEERRQAGY